MRKAPSHSLPSSTGPIKFTQKIVDALQLPTGKAESIIFDQSIPGLGLRIRAGGSRSWVFQYTLRDQQRRMTLGRTSAVKLDEARATASKLYSQVKLGFDPASERNERRAQVAETFGAALQLYLPHQQAQVRPRSFVEIDRYLSRYLRPLHGLQLAKIDRRAIAEQLSRIENAHGQAARNRARTCLSALFSWCMAEGLADANPVIGTARREETSRDRVLDPAELRTVWRALGDDEFSAIVRLLCLTGQRREEIGGLRWSEIDLESGVIRLPAERVKNNSEHTVPLSTPARAILEGQSQRDGRDYVFGRGQGGFSGWSRCKARLDARIAEMTGKPLPGWTLHDLRRSFVTHIAEAGIAPPHVLEAIINHISGSKSGVAGVYNKSTYEKEKTAALVHWADHFFRTIVGGTARRVIPLRAAEVMVDAARRSR
jgi:integrase